MKRDEPVFTHSFLTPSGLWVVLVLVGSLTSFCGVRKKSQLDKMGPEPIGHKWSYGAALNGLVSGVKGPHL